MSWKNLFQISFFLIFSVGGSRAQNVEVTQFGERIQRSGLNQEKGLIRFLLPKEEIIIPAGNLQENPDEPLAPKVQKSIEKAIEFLRDKENGNGHWELDGEAAARKGGWTSLAMLALLNAGVKADDPMMERGLVYLRKIDPEQTYTVGLQTMVFVQAGNPQDKPFIQRNVDWLIKNRIPAQNMRAGGWGYRPGLGSADNSNTQYALLGIHEGLKAGAVVPEKILRQIQTDILKIQQADGGWSYRNEPFTSLTMTTAGLCNLIITGMDLMKGKQKLPPDGLADDCGIYDENQALVKAVRWLGDGFPARIRTREDAQRGLKHPFYAFYGVERAGRFTGQRFFGGHDWYRVGADFLVKTQGNNGSWGNEAGFGSLDNWPVVATSFSLLFLAKGRTPVIITKFAHHTEESWNRKHHDLRHLVPFVSARVFEGAPLAWQVFDTERIGLTGKKEISDCCQQLLEIPVVWLSGHGVVPEKSQRELLKEYLDKGGFLFAEACCGSPDFDKDFRAMVKDLYPNQPLELLPKDHPIWGASGKFLSKPEEFPLYGIVQGKKTVVVYSPKPISGYWEANLQSDSRGLGAFNLGANVIAYATGKKVPPPRLSGVEPPKP